DLVKSGAKSITFYINSDVDSAFTYGFGVSISKEPWWNELDASGKFIDTKGGTVDADGTPTKLTAGLNKVTIDLSSLSLSYSDSSSQYGEHFEFRNYYADKNANLKITDVKINDTSAPVTTATTTKATTTTTKTTTTTTKATTTTTKATTTTTKAPTTTTTVKPVTGVTVYGDANDDGQVNLSDAVMIMQALANPNKYGLNGSSSMHINAQGWANADCKDNGNGVTNADALAIQEMLLKLVTLPC
ncbi:MAG: dockerin type I repeat-containing protein, partial [Ruminococcus sp.]|nr:dockerin type I repeat-containing protein [Ruminococcus sp.]